MPNYIITVKAGPYVAGQRNTGVGTRLSLSKRAAEHELRLGTLIEENADVLAPRAQLKPSSVSAKSTKSAKSANDRDSEAAAKSPPEEHSLMAVISPTNNLAEDDGHDKRQDVAD